MELELLSNQYANSTSTSLHPLPVFQGSFLCARCRDVQWQSSERASDRAWDPKKTRWFFYTAQDPENWLASTCSNCRLCNIIRMTASTRVAAPNFECALFFDSNQALFTSLRLDVMQFQLLPIASAESTRSSNLFLPDDSSSEASLACAKDWYTRCVTSHRSCMPGQLMPGNNSHALPTRLIDVGSHALQEPRLVITEEFSPQTAPVQYLTLSHSWGHGVPLKLLKANIEALRSSIPLDSLSQTFQDAIFVTRKFGFQYIWIDSLCIIQDCAEDWRKESSSMRDIYKGGICNIAATAASSGANGLFTRRDPWAISPFNIEVSGNDYGQHYQCSLGSVRYDGFINAPLNRRGWVYQERLMSPRTIHFSTQLFWECKELEASETYPIGIDPTRHIPDVDQSYKSERNAVARKLSLQKKSWLNDILSDIDSRYKVWMNIVSDYTCCALTEDRDKLIAISGLVKEIRPFMDDEYVGGLWRKNLINELVWWIEDSKQADGADAYRPQRYRAPSWSWASVEGRVQFPLAYNPKSWLRIVEVSVTPVSDDLTGEIVDGWIKIDGMIKPLPVEPSFVREHLPYRGTGTGICIDTSWEDDDLKGLFLLPVASYDGLGESEQELYGLLLRPANRDSAVYRRVGLVALEYEGYSTTIFGLKCDFWRTDLGWDIPSQLIVII